MNELQAEPASATGASLAMQLPRALDGPRPLRMMGTDGFRLLVDRDLPFMCIARSRTMSERESAPPRERAEPGAAIGTMPSLAARIASAGAVHALWPRSWGRDEQAQVIRLIADHMQARFGTKLLVIEVHDLDEPVGIVPGSESKPPFEIEVGVCNLPPETGALAAMVGALGRIRIDYRTPGIRVIDPLLRPVADDVALLSLGLPAIHLAADRSRFYPALLHRMEAAVIDTVLRAAWAYSHAVLDPVSQTSRLVAGRHHRALGRQALDAAARTVDRQLTAIASAYELLLDLTPVNSAEAEAEFRSTGGVAAPSLRYRPLSISPGELKRSLFSINIGRIEDPVLEDLFYEKQREIDQQLTLLQLRETTRFRDASRVLYGAVSDGLLATARAVIQDIQALSGKRAIPDQAVDGNAGRADADTAGGDPYAPPTLLVDARGVHAAAEAAIARYRAQWPAFAATAHLRDDLPAGLMVSGPRLLISSRTRTPLARLPALLEHEVGVHLLTYFNGDAQGLRVFRSGLAGYERIQEGLAVLAEFATGGTGYDRLRLLAARVLAVHAMQAGASFVETTRLLRREAGLADPEAFNVTLRVHRGGGLSKDAIYLQGLQQVLQHLAGGGDLDTLWLGKIAAHHIGVVQELVARGMLASARLRPAFVSTASGTAFIRKVAAGVRLTDLVHAGAAP